MQVHGEIDIILGNGQGDLCSNLLDERVFISHRDNTIRKAMKPNTLPSAMDTIVGQTGRLNFVMATGLGKGRL